MRKLLLTLLIISHTCLISLSQGTGKPILFISAGTHAQASGSGIISPFLARGHNIETVDKEHVPAALEQNGRYKLVWLHVSDSNQAGPFFTDQQFNEAILNYVTGGGKLLLTGCAMHYLNIAGIETEAVRCRAKTSSDNGYGRMLGFHAFLSHPLFDGLNGGAYVWKPPTDTIVMQCGFFGESVPKTGKVAAVDWDYIFVREDSRIIIEYEHGKGRILAIGAYLTAGSPNINQLHYELFYGNVFSYLGGEKDDEEKHYWLYGDKHTKRLEAVFMKQFVAPPPARWELKKSPLALSRDKAKQEYCEASGSRLLLAAYEPAGIFEAWAHPFMAFRAFHTSLIYPDTTIRLADGRASIEITPESIVRKYTFLNDISLVEVITVSPDRPVGVIHYEYDGPPAKLAIRYRSNLRLMWPYSGDVLKTFEHGFDPAFNAMVFRAPEAGLNVMLGANRLPLAKYSGRATDPEPEFHFGEILADDDALRHDTLFELMAGQVFALGEHDAIDIVFSAGSEGGDSIRNAYMRTMQDPEAIYREALAHYKSLQDDRLSFYTPDTNFNKGFAWAVAATDKFMVETPGLGTSLVAGYNGTDRGWDGGHAVNGRPGYAWYFGRDAVWSAFALLDYGDHEGVREVLDMLVRYQDLNGKIFHELSTSGFVHYDASDATPLFVILAGRYLKHSGDTAYVRSTWPSVLRAMEYCRSTDTDGDGLIENTNVGHGWVEGGHLFGSHTSLYLASCWAEALAEAAGIAGSLGMEDYQEQFSTASSTVKEMIATQFFNEESGFMYQGLFKDGTYHAEESIMPAVPMYFGHIPAALAEGMLKEYASSEYSSDWGVRMAAVSSPYYHPQGYHSGSVWPLFTGWVALAEYKMGRSLQGFMHITNNLNIYRDFSPGYMEEVLRGDKYAPSGVCPHQCWSETMLIQPVIEGMLGITPDATRNEIVISPALPIEWDSISVSNIRIGEMNMNFSMLRQQNNIRYTFSHDGPDSFKIIFCPQFEDGASVQKVWINGKKAPEKSYHKDGNTAEIVLYLTGHCVIEISLSGGIGLLTPANRPLPNEASSNLRIIDTQFEDGNYIITLEGAPGMKYELQLLNRLGAPQKVTGATYRSDKDILHLEVMFPAMEQAYQRRRIEIQF